MSQEGGTVLTNKNTSTLSQQLLPIQSPTRKKISLINSSYLTFCITETYYPIAFNDTEANAAHPFPKNVTKTSKYTWWNFIFKNLYEQYHRLVNVCFLLSSINNILLSFHTCYIAYRYTILCSIITFSFFLFPYFPPFPCFSFFFFLSFSFLLMFLIPSLFQIDLFSHSCYHRPYSANFSYQSNDFNSTNSIHSHHHCTS